MKTTDSPALPDMIYSTPKTLFPSDDQYTECHAYKDENDFEWKIARVQNGFFVAYFGDDYFQDKYFSLDVGDKHQLLMNTGCFFVQDISFEAFYDFRTILKEGYTDDIWECIAEFLTIRLRHDPGLLECEMVSR